MSEEEFWNSCPFLFIDMYKEFEHRQMQKVGDIFGR